MISLLRETDARPARHHARQQINAYIRKTIDKEIITVLEQIISLHERLRLLRERRNQLAPVYRLPLEVLASIFRHCLPTAGSAPFFPASHRFSHVCRHWRYVALDCAALWTVVPRGTLGLTKKFLSRSKNAPISIYSSRNCKSEAPLLRALGEFPRVRSLNISLPQSSTHESRLSCPAPLLADCTIHGNILAEPWLPDDFLGLSAPKLRRLNLQAVAIKWRTLQHASLVQGLTSLELNFLAIQSFPTGRDFVTALRAMTSLRHLLVRMSLSCYGDEYPEHMAECEEKATMRQLTSLELYGPGPHICYLLSGLDVPSTAALSIGLESEEESDDQLWDINPLLSFLDSHCTCQDEGPSASILDFSIAFDSHHQALTAYPAKDDGPGPYRSRSHLLHLNIVQDWRAMLRVFRNLNLDRLTTVTADLRYEHENSDPLPITQFLERCGAATQVHLTSPETCEDVLPLLFVPPSPDMMLFPKLRQLALHLGMFGTRYSLVPDCEDVLIGRYETFDVMVELAVKNPCVMDPGDLDKLRRVTTVDILS